MKSPEVKQGCDYHKLELTLQSKRDLAKIESLPKGQEFLNELFDFYQEFSSEKSFQLKEILQSSILYGIELLKALNKIAIKHEMPEETEPFSEEFFYFLAQKIFTLGSVNPEERLKDDLTITKQGRKLFKFLENIAKDYQTQNKQMLFERILLIQEIVSGEVGNSKKKPEFKQNLTHAFEVMGVPFSQTKTYPSDDEILELAKSLFLKEQGSTEIMDFQDVTRKKMQEVMTFKRQLLQEILQKLQTQADPLELFQKMQNLMPIDPKEFQEKNGASLSFLKKNCLQFCVSISLLEEKHLNLDCLAISLKQAEMRLLQKKDLAF